MTRARPPVIPLTEAACAPPFAEAGSKVNEGGQLRRLLDRVRWVAAGRAGLAALIDTVLAVSALTVVAGAGAAWTLRGDVAAQLLALGSGGAGVLALAFATRRFAAIAGTRVRAAATIAGATGDLGRRADPLDGALRHEIRGAFDLFEGRGRAGSAELRATYIGDVEMRLSARGVRPGAALGRARVARRTLAAIIILATILIASRFDTWTAGFERLRHGIDAREPPPPQPVWSALSLELSYPEHTGRPSRTVPNPSGALRAPAGTRVHLSLTPRVVANAGAVVVAYDPDELSRAPASERTALSPGADGTLQGEFVVRGSGSWTVVLGEGEEDAHRSAALPVELEPDRAPEIEVLPLSPAEQSVRDDDEVVIRWNAQDDFGVAAVELVYQLADGTTHRLPTQAPPSATRAWRTHTPWDISTIPSAARDEVLYWLEVVDNDPGLGLVPLPDGPGKRTKSATMRLQVEDEQAEHAENIASLRELRDAAVDALAARMLTPAFTDDGTSLAPRVEAARSLLAQIEALLTGMAATVDAISVDALAQDRDAKTLAGIHARLLAIHRKESAAHAALVPGLELDDPPRAAAELGRIAPLHAQMRVALEDESIRLDDMVDGMLLERLEALVARLEATQRKLIELLEALQAGDETVRDQIEQLEQRRREDLRRLSEIRAQLRDELEQEYMNSDAFAILEQMAADEELQAMLQRGEVDRALERARGELDEVSRMRDQVQQQAGEGGPASPLSEEERKRIELLRELSRLQDEEGALRNRTGELQRNWREAVADRKASATDADAARKRGAAIREMLEEINDARLGREARRGLEDANAALDRLEQASGAGEPSALELADAADAALDGINRALSGAERREQEGKSLERAQGRAEALRDELDGNLPSVAEVLPDAERQEFDALGERQQGLRDRAAEVLRGELGDLLPPAGRQGMRRADSGMGRSSRALDQKTPREAIGGQGQAWQGLQEAIDSLRRGPPPPPAGASGDASTEAERDRTLRDALLDAMREDAPTGFVDPVRRYYEELLR
jgi:hypothetical protein